jgi:ferrous iron transporter FeoB
MIATAPRRTAAATQTIALAGNPNCGKSTLFNALTGLRQKVANYPGVTVEKKTGRCRGLHGESLDVIDLPGSYSLEPRSPDEEIAREILLGRRGDTPRPGLVVSVVDASNIERNLYLTTQIIELGVPVVVAMNMVDVAEAKGLRIDPKALATRLGVPVIPMVASKGVGLVELKQAISSATPPAQPASEYRNVESRYAWIHEICADAVRRPGDPPRTWTDRIDAVLTHRLWGWMFFAAIMALIFYAIFAVAEWPMTWIEEATAVVAGWIESSLPPGDLRSLLADGVIAGVGGVVVFLPQIVILFFFLGLLEDSGYMARAAFIMDRVMALVGLNGKSFIPLLSSFACAIPGIMATRTIEDRRERMATIFVAPFMSCSARLPVYALMIALLFPSNDVGALGRAGVMLAMYALGVAAAFGTAWIFQRASTRRDRPMLLMEMPPYRTPSLGAVLLRIRERAVLFLVNAGTVILALSIVLWALMTYPKPASPDISAAEALSQSVAGRLGRVIEPALEPLGFDWKIGIGLIASFAAREVFVGTMAIVYNVGEESGEPEVLRDVLRSQTRPDGVPVFTPLVCVGLMVFYVLAMQCMSTMAIVRRETNSWRWPLAQLVYMTALAYLAALVVHQGGTWMGFQ